MILIDLLPNRYLPFRERKSGRTAQARVWEETRQELESKVPDVKAVCKLLGDDSTE